MSLFKVFDVAGSGMVAQSQRLNVVTSNLANAESVGGPDGKAYKARQVVFQMTDVAPSRPGQGPLPPTAPLSPGSVAAAGGVAIASLGDSTGVRVAAVIEDPSPGRRILDPKNPAADENGYVTLPNVNVVEEMVNMISASRSYQTNVEVMNTAKTMLMRTLQIGS